MKQILTRYKLDQQNRFYNIPYHCNRHLTMIDLIPFLQEHHDNMIFGEAIPVKIFVPQTYRTFNFTVSLLENNALLRDEATKNVYTFNSRIKMEPKYAVLSSKTETLASIKMHLDQSQILLQDQNTENLVKIYNKLKILLSHKGFNDYFKPIKRLGKGAFATVYLIEHKVTKVRFAAKVFSREGQKIEFKGQQALQNQIRTLRFLSHQNIIRYQGVYETENLIYLVTEYLSGGTLEQTMRNKTNLGGDLVLQVISETLKALAYLEKNHIMHRDLKPENILLRESDKKWVLADFGLSAFMNEDYLYDKCGTMGYIAPQILSEKTSENQTPKLYNSACDLYSLGVIAYNLIVGSLPFKVQVESMFDRKIVWNAFNRDQCEQIHPEIIVFLQGLLEQNPQKRLNPETALASSFFNNKQVVSSWLAFNKKKIDQRFDKILKLANYN